MNTKTDMPPFAEEYDRYPVILAASVLYTLGLLVPFTIPALMGIVAEQWEASGSQLGLWAGMHSLSLAITGISSFYWVRRLNRRTGSFYGILVLGIAIGLHSVATDFTQLLVLMSVGGIGGGMLSAMAIATLSMGSNPQRNFGIMIFCSVVIPAIVIAVIPLTVSWVGYSGAILIIAGFILICSSLAFVLPASGDSGQDETPKNDSDVIIYDKASRARMIFVLAGMLIFMVGFIGAWSFFERMGNQSGLGQGSIYKAIAVGQLVGGLGGFLAIWMSRCLGLRWSFVLACVLTVLTLLCLELVSITIAVYLVLISSFMLWIMVNISNFASYIANIDAKGRVVSMIPGLQAIGSFAGSIIAGFAFEGGGKGGVVTVSAVALLLCVVFMLVAFKLSSKEDMEFSSEV